MLGGGAALMDLPASYVECVQKMLKAAADWVACRGRVGVLFTLPSQDVALAAPLSAPWIDLLAATEKARELLVHVDEQTGHEATCLQACFVVRELGLPFEEWNNDKLAALLRGARGAGLS